MTTRIIVKNLPKKITEEKFQEHFSNIGRITDAKLKYTKEGKFRQFGFVGFKHEDEARKAIEYFNNTYIDASKIQIEECKPLNDSNRKTWSKHTSQSKKILKASDKGLIEVDSLEASVKSDEEKKNKKEKKLDMLLGDLRDDEGFREFLAANKAIKSNDSLWKNDTNLNVKKDKNARVNDKTSDDSLNKSGKSAETSTTLSEEEQVSKSILNARKGDEDDVEFENGRLFIRNLSYTCQEEDLEKLFEPYAPLVEVSMPIDNFSKRPKGFAYITCMFPEKAIKAFNDLDGSIYQGRMLHIIPAKSKANVEADESSSSSSFKSKKEAELKKSAQSGHNWNTLFINQDSVANLMADKYQVDKADIYDVHQRSGRKNVSSTAVKLAVGETQIVNDIRKFLQRNGVKLDAFQAGQATERSKTCILVKNLPNKTSESELKEFFKKCGVDYENCVKRFVMPEYGIAALVEFGERQEARDAFKKLAYKKFKAVPIYLEWAPVDVFDGEKEEEEEEEEEEKDKDKNVSQNEKKSENKDTAAAESEMKEEEEEEEEESDGEYENNATLFVKNLNFDTSEESLKKLFGQIGKCKVTIARKIAPNKELLSMGYGFVQFKRAAHANEAIKSLQDQSLDGHNLELKYSNKTGKNEVSRESVRKQQHQKELSERSSKILVRNVPFEAKTKEIEDLFQVFGELKYVRLPKKVDGTHRGFGFVDFVTISDAQKAFEALCHSTHLFGRRLVLEWAEPEQTQDVEILRAREEALAGPSSHSKRMKKSKILDDLESGIQNNKMDINQ